MKNFKPLYIIGALCLSLAGNAQIGKPARDLEDKTILYELERNDPANSGLFGVNVDPVYIDGSKLNLNIGGGLGVFYTWRSNLRISAGFQYAYLDNLTGDDFKGEPVGSHESYGTPVNNKKTTRFNIMISPTIRKWEKEMSHHITLGNAGYRTVAVTRVKGNVLRAITGRLGYQMENRKIQASGGDMLKATANDYVYHYQGNTYTLTPTDVAASPTMMQSNIAVIGIAYSVFRDIKISLDDDTYKGRRQEKTQADLFFDLLYATKLSIQDMVYYHSLYNLTGEREHLRQRVDLSATPLEKIGVRMGYQIVGMNWNHVGSRILLEGGLRPGPKGEKKEANLYALITFGFNFGGRIAATEE